MPYITIESGALSDEQKENGVTEYRDYASFEEALQDFYDNN